MFHLTRAVGQLDHALECANNGRRRPQAKIGDTQLLTVGAYLPQLEENAVEKGKAGLAISLARPFQRLLKHHVMFRCLLFGTNLVIPEYEGALTIVTEVEAILGSIENEGIQREECYRTWDVLERIDGLDKVRQFAVPKPSQILMEERRIPPGVTQ